MMSKKRAQEIKAKKIKDEVDEWESYEPKYADYTGVNKRFKKRPQESEPDAD